MNKYHVGASCLGAAIYAGRLNSKGTEWLEKNDVKDEAINATRDYMIDNVLGGFNCSKNKTGGYEWVLKDGRLVKLMITISKPPEGETE